LIPLCADAVLAQENCRAHPAGVFGGGFSRPWEKVIQGLQGLKPLKKKADFCRA
jgi:hypothetical protein